MAIYVISDIHGCFDEFKNVLECACFGEGDELYILGDLVDRGPQVGDCINWLVEHGANAEGSNIHFLMGNHEEMMCDSFVGPWSRFELDEVFLPTWQINGGNKTLEQVRELDPAVLASFQRIVKKAPKSETVHIADGLVLLSHAGIRPAEPDSEPAEWLIQSDDDLMWIGQGWYARDEQAPFHVISGHVPTFSLCSRGLQFCPDTVRKDGRCSRMMHWGCRHNIDCGCVFGGRMGLLRLDDREEFYVDCAQGLRRGR